MTVINYAAREINCKLVYYGPGYCGKTTNVQYIQNHTRAERRGKLISLATESERTLMFDFMPLDIGTIGRFKVRMHLYTVPGQIFYAATRRLVLRGADGVVFVADSQPGRFEANLESIEDLRGSLAEHHKPLAELPVVLQCNKQDIPGAMDPEELRAAMQLEAIPCFPASAVSGEGVFETLRAVSKAVIRSLRERTSSARNSARSSQTRSRTRS